jgi:hypothetical protein
MLRTGLALLASLLLGPSVWAQSTVVYDDGGDHVLSAYAEIPEPNDALIEVRDGPGSDPTSLDVTIAGDLYDLDFRVYDHSDLELLGRIGYASVTAYDDSTVHWLQALGYGTVATALDRSSVEVSAFIESAGADHEARLILNGGADGFTGRGQSTTTLTGGSLYRAHLYDSAVMHMTGGRYGFDTGSVNDDAYLLVEGTARIDGSYGFSVSGNGRADIHSGPLTPASPFFSVGISGFGLVRLFGEDWAIDGVPVGFGDVGALAGGAQRTGRLTGILESGDVVDTDFRVQDSGILRLLPEPGSGLAIATGLVLALRAGSRRRGRFETDATAARTGESGEAGAPAKSSAAHRDPPS